MVKIERTNGENAKIAIASLEKEKQKKNGNYNASEIFDAINEIFHGKCYLCEQRGFYQVEHLIPHKGNKDLEFEWNNLFLACPHCNNIKRDKYTPILDCCKVDVDQKIAFRKHGYWGTEEYLEFTALSDDAETKMTVKLLEEIHHGSTPQKQAEAKILYVKIVKSMRTFKNYVLEYEAAKGQTKLDTLELIKLELKSTSEFTAFKRWLIRDAKEKSPELQQYCQ